MSIDSPSLLQLLESLATGATSIAETEERIAELSQRATSSPEVRIDLDRQDRCGFPEVIYAPGKSNEALEAGFQALLESEQNCLATRCTAEQADFLLDRFSQAVHNSMARTVSIQQQQEKFGQVGVISAGTSDLPVMKEAVATLAWMNVNVREFVDVGVAGPQRFLQIKDQLDDCSVVIVVAGMEGALPSVVGGWVDCPVIAVPTSVGYGAAFGGLAALLGMLNSCAANVAVVNIDAGFKAGYLAGMMAHQVSGIK